jgi:hypothetical protein
MSHIHVWLGDSWTIGSELKFTVRDRLESELTAPLQYKVSKYFPNAGFTSDPMLAYPFFVSSYFNVKHYNLAKPSCSYDFMYHELLMFLKNTYKEENTYTVFLQTTGQQRHFGKTESGKHVHYNNIPFNGFNSIVNNDTDRAPYIIYDSTVALNNIYLLCEKYNMPLKIIPLWTDMITDQEVNLVPDSCWVHSKEKNMLSDIFGIEAPFPGSTFDLSTMTQQQIADTLMALPYIKENSNGHPTENAHQQIAQYLIKVLDN